VLVVFDLDGTLTDPYDGITRCVVHAFERLGRPVPPDDALSGFIGPPLQDTFAEWLGTDAANAVRLYRERFDEVGWRENRVYDGVEEALGKLAMGGHTLAVATSKPTVFARRILNHFGLSRRFTVVVGASLDGSLRHKADLLELVLKRSATAAPDAVMVGDRAQDLQGAKAHQVRAVGVSWGYGAPGELEAAGADAIAHSPAELLVVIQQ
jgi:phosphoglycolate phosphatase